MSDFGNSCNLGGWDYGEKHNMLILDLKTGSVKMDRPVIQPPPQTRKILDVTTCVITKNYRRGSASPLSHRENLHLTIRPLRQAAYHRLGVTGTIRECFPGWEDGHVVWSDDQVMPDATLDYLLESPQEAVRYFFPSFE